jgi:hypothetical protein
VRPPRPEAVLEGEIDRFGRTIAERLASHRGFRLATLVSQAAGDSMAACCCGDMAYQRA